MILRMRISIRKTGIRLWNKRTGVHGSGVGRLLYNTEAIVVRSIAYGETHAIVTLLTPTGLVACMARGAKKPQSRLVAAVQLCVQGIYSVYQRSGMGTVQQVEIVQSHRKLREDLRLAAYAAYFCELVLAIADDRPAGSEAVYRLFSGLLERLETGVDNPAVLARIWETKCLSFLGSSPDWTNCVRCGAYSPQATVYSPAEGGFLCQACHTADQASAGRRRVMPVPSAVPRVLTAFEQIPWSRLGNVNLSKPTQQALERVLTMQLREFAGLSMKSRDFLQTIEEVFGNEES